MLTRAAASDLLVEGEESSCCVSVTDCDSTAVLLLLFAVSPLILNIRGLQAMTGSSTKQLLQEQDCFHMQGETFETHTGENNRRTEAASSRLVRRFQFQHFIRM